MEDKELEKLLTKLRQFYEENKEELIAYQIKCYKGIFIAIRDKLKGG